MHKQAYVDSSNNEAHEMHRRVVRSIMKRHVKAQREIRKRGEEDGKTLMYLFKPVYDAFREAKKDVEARTIWGVCCEVLYTGHVLFAHYNLSITTQIMRSKLGGIPGQPQDDRLLAFYTPVRIGSIMESYREFSIEHRLCDWAMTREQKTTMPFARTDFVLEEFKDARGKWWGGRHPTSVLFCARDLWAVAKECLQDVADSKHQDTKAMIQYVRMLGEDYGCGDPNEIMKELGLPLLDLSPPVEECDASSVPVDASDAAVEKLATGIKEMGLLEDDSSQFCQNQELYDVAKQIIAMSKGMDKKEYIQMRNPVVSGVPLPPRSIYVESDAAVSVAEAVPDEKDKDMNVETSDAYYIQTEQEQ